YYYLQAITKPVTDECAFIEENAGFIFGNLTSLNLLT
ncbi:hypothetical protein C5167_025874, partial [Papaver somniferum]